MLKQEEYQENLLGAVQILIDSSIKGLQYDKTIICSVVKNDKAKQGEYTVSDGSITFSAYSNGTEYFVGDTVRVQIPQGDMSQDKFIQGKYVADKGTSAMTYVSPMESILDISDSLVNKLSSGIIVTGYSKDVVTQQIILKELISIEFNDSNNFNYSNLKSNKIVDTFYMQASFKTLFAGYQIMSGEYGIRADFYDNNNTIRSLYLSSKDMFGDPYNFMIYSQQGQTYSLENIDNIKRIVFYLYHNDAFSYLSENGTINSIPVFGNANVLLKDFAAGFATDLSGIEDNTVKLFTPNQTYFSNDEILKDVVNDKILQLLWYNKDENHRYIGFSDGICDTNYDELEYIAERKAISRLIPHLSNWRVPHDEKGLKLTADKEDFEPLLDKLYNLLNNDFYKTLNNYRARFKETLRALINVPKSNISKLGTVIQSIKDYYTNCLYYGCFYNPRVDIIDKETGDPIQPKIEDQPFFPTYYACWDNLKTVYDDITEDFQNDSFLKSLKDEIESNATDYMGLYNSLKAKINVIIKEANEILTSIEFLLEDESKLLLYHYNSAIGYGEYFKDTDTYKNYINPENDKDTSNRYCIYWYRYDPLEKLYNDKEYVKGDPFFGEKWIRCKEWTNRGLPHDGINGKYYELTRFAGNTQASVILESDKMQEERFRVVLFYNHVRYDSNVLIFNNLTDLVSSTTEALTNYIKISHSNNSRDHYQSYDECNNLINASDAFSQRKLTVSYHINDKLIDNERLKGAHICWYIPNNLTMLDCYDKDYDGKNATISDKPAGASLTECGWNAKPGYKSIYYQMSEDEIEEDKLTFIYRIKSYYEHFNTQNTILCKIITADEYEYEAELPITFSSYGTSGTNYTLSIRPKKDQIVVMDEEDQSLRLGVYLYNYDNSPIEISNLKVSVQGASSIYTADWNEENKEIVISKKEDPEREEQYFGIVSATTTIIDENQNNKSLDLTAYYPLAYCQENYFIKGPTVVTYDSAGGSNPKYNGSAYQLFSQKDKIEIPIEKCEIIGKDEIKDIERHFLPTINDNNQLKPCAFYVDNIVNDKNNYSFPVIVKITTKENTIFYQSLFIHQNRYGSPMLNAWDGSFVIDEEAGTIMSTMVGAGKKNNDNTFSGVLMGDITSSGLDSGSGIGLYGFHEGAQSFNFNVDGTAFLGKAGHGRIHFNGNTGTIQSASFSQLKGGAGMLIDLDDGYLEMRGAIGSMEDGYSVDSQSKIYLGVTERDNAYFSIHSKNGNPLIKIGTEEYFLQTDNFSDGTDTYKLEDITYGEKELYLRTKKAGTRINLQNGKITSYNFTIDAENDAGGKVFLSSDNNEKFPFYIKEKKSEEEKIFSVGWDGSILATAGQIGKDEAGHGLLAINGILTLLVPNVEDSGSTLLEKSINNQMYMQYNSGMIPEGEKGRFYLTKQNFGITYNDYFLGSPGFFMRPASKTYRKGFRLTSDRLAIEGSDNNGSRSNGETALTEYTGNGFLLYQKEKDAGNILFGDVERDKLSLIGSIYSSSDALNIKANTIKLLGTVELTNYSADNFPIEGSYETIGGMKTVLNNFLTTQYPLTITSLDERISDLEIELVEARNTIKSQSETIKNQSEIIESCRAGCEGADCCDTGMCPISQQGSSTPSE